MPESLIAWIATLLAPACGGALGWWMYRRHERDDAAPADPYGAEVLAKVRAPYEPHNLGDADRVALLEQHAFRFRNDSDYLRTLRFHLTLARRWDDARQVVAQAERHGTLPPDVARVEQGYIDLEESRRGDRQPGTELEQRAVLAAQAVIQKWPEWQEGYLLLSEARSSLGFDQDHGLVVQRFWTGAWIRNLEPLAAPALAGAVATVALWFLGLAVHGAVEAWRVQAWLGTAAFGLLAGGLAWGCWQRYRVAATPWDGWTGLAATRSVRTG